MRKQQISKPRADIYPLPSTLVTCWDGEKTNVLTVSWTGVLCSSPPIIYISIRPKRFSYALLENTKRFCLNIPRRSQLPEVDYCGTVSGRTEEKVDRCGFTLVSLNPKFPPAIEQCPHHLLCEVIEVLSYGSHSAFVSNVSEEYIDEDCLNNDGSINYEAIHPIAYCRKKYYSVQEEIGIYGCAHKQIDNIT